MQYTKINKAIESGLLSGDLCEIVPPPKEEEILRFKSASLNLNDQHMQLLLEWGGSNLDEIRINALSDIESHESYIVFANDYSGYKFGYNSSGCVYAIDTDGGEIKKLTSSIVEFINDFLFGKNGREFYGSEWVENLNKHGLA